uniref:Uncharacterized protein n=1 Tax=Romanomermis culicivorax TaxID=13658 RepID=A0A915IQU9_ROMCU
MDGRYGEQNRVRGGTATIIQRMVDGRLNRRLRNQENLPIYVTSRELTFTLPFYVTSGLPLPSQAQNKIVLRGFHWEIFNVFINACDKAKLIAVPDELIDINEMNVLQEGQDSRALWGRLQFALKSRAGRRTVEPFHHCLAVSSYCWSKASCGPKGVDVPLLISVQVFSVSSAKKSVFGWPVIGCDRRTSYSSVSTLSRP